MIYVPEPYLVDVRFSASSSTLKNFDRQEIFLEIVFFNPLQLNLILWECCHGSNIFYFIIIASRYI